MTTPVLRLLWIARISLLLTFVPHVVSKMTGFEVFVEKFSITPTLTVLLILAELAGVIGVFLGGALPGRWGLYATWAGTGPLIVSQAGAIAVARFPRWFEFAIGGGAEYNVMIILMCVLLTLGHLLALRPEPVLWRRGEPDEPLREPGSPSGEPGGADGR